MDVFKLDLLNLLEIFNLSVHQVHSFAYLSFGFMFIHDVSDHLFLAPTCECCVHGIESLRHFYHLLLYVFLYLSLYSFVITVEIISVLVSETSAVHVVVSFRGLSIQVVRTERGLRAEFLREFFVKLLVDCIDFSFFFFFLEFMFRE